MTTSVTLLVGTTKGAFLLSSDSTRENWSVNGPHCGGWSINHVISDPQTGMLYAGGGSGWSGAGIWRSADQGTTWELSKLSWGGMDEWLDRDPDFAAEIGIPAPDPAPFTGEIESVWSLGQAGGTLYAGTKPGNLLTSTDQGQSWQLVDTLANHPTRATWNPGAAGLVLHTIISDPAAPNKLWVAISAAGTFATDDGGQSWERRNRLSNAPSLHEHGHDHGADTGLCVHNMVRADGDLMYQQNHHGVFRSQDGGRSWQDISDGLPSRFGFPIALHPHDPQTIWTLPLNGDMAGRFPPDASAAVWRSQDGGESWSRMGNGLPQQNCFFTVLRQAMATDTLAQPGVYFGTNSGSIFASTDTGENWREIARHLPTVLSVETVTAAASAL
ncbi:WD40/YVTN/BNR-like repeat-containing protein [Pelagovum sp. HNIBRBA483]|uniref:WD40/YVTN/BNR-like repeat-containing protein n=1 Tax=Pelagovum sp. HNIBRBA483 TaxID=3233341 RepID=UPI0034A2A9C6